MFRELIAGYLALGCILRSDLKSSHIRVPHSSGADVPVLWVGQAAHSALAAWDWRPGCSSFEIDVKRAPMILFVVIFDLAADGAGQQFSLISVAFLHEKLLN